MKQNMPFTILISVVFGLMAVSTFYFWLKGNIVRWKYNREWHHEGNPLIAAKREYAIKCSRKAFYCFLVGGLIEIVLFFLQGTGNLFIDE